MVLQDFHVEAADVTDQVGLNGGGGAFDGLAKPDAHCKVLVTP